MWGPTALEFFKNPTTSIETSRWAVHAARRAEDAGALLRAALAAHCLLGERGARTMIDAALETAHAEDAHA